MDYCRKQVMQDCEELLARFQQTQSVRFDTFSDIWREMNFSHIFYGTLSSEGRAFSRHILDTACRFFLPPFTFQIRAGGLYLLYGLYHSQNTTPPEKIRLALKDWEDFKKFECDAVNAQHLDVVYILRHLKFLKAFHFTAMPGLLNYQVKRKVERLPMSLNFMDQASRPQELVNVDLLEELSNIHERYEQLKTSISSTPGEPDPSVSLIHGDFVPKLRNTMLDFHTWQKRRTAPVEDGGEVKEDSGEGASAQQECSRRAELLASIKSKSFGQAVEAPKSRRHRQVELSTTSESSPANMADELKDRKLSLKAKTIADVQLKGDGWKETIKCTKVWELSTLDSTDKDVPRSHRRFKW